MKKIFLFLILMLSISCSSVHADSVDNFSTYDVVKGLVPQDKCPIQIKNEKADFYDCGTYTLTYTKEPYGIDKKYFKYCSKKPDGSLKECFYM